MKIRQNIMCLAVALAFFASPMAWGARPQARTMHGVIQSIDREACTITIMPENAVEALVFEWKDQTRFLENGRFVDSRSLSKGSPVEIRYRSPFFGNKFVTRVIRTNSSHGSHTPN